MKRTPPSEETETPLSSEGMNFDSVFINSRRESIVLLVGFAVFFLWSIGASYFLGYANDLKDAETLRTVMGVPRWVFWGVAVPWIAANIFTFWFCLFYMADDPLGEALDESRNVAPAGAQGEVGVDEETRKEQG